MSKSVINKSAIQGLEMTKCGIIQMRNIHRLIYDKTVMKSKYDRQQPTIKHASLFHVIQTWSRVPEAVCLGNTKIKHSLFFNKHQF